MMRIFCLFYPCAYYAIRVCFYSLQSNKIGLGCNHLSKDKVSGMRSPDSLALKCDHPSGVEVGGNAIAHFGQHHQVCSEMAALDGLAEEMRSPCLSINSRNLIECNFLVATEQGQLFI
jgi:hypothetical protein